MRGEKEISQSWMCHHHDAIALFTDVMVLSLRVQMNAHAQCARARHLTVPGLRDSNFTLIFSPPSATTYSTFDHCMFVLLFLLSLLYVSFI